VSADLVALAVAASRVAVVEDNVVVGGIGSQVELALRDAGLATPVHQLGIPKEFLDHGSRGQVLDRAGLTPDAVAGRLRERLA
jgi:1-deoxy-D-xylulose-5-phosphate synthase